MPDRSSNPRSLRQINELAAAIVEAASEGEPNVVDKRDPAVVALGLKCGKARTVKLTW